MARDRETTDLIVVHCSATKPRQRVDAKRIHGWHVKRGIYSERGITGYHFVVLRSGEVELGRELDEIGAHALGYNQRSVGICLVGGLADDGTPTANYTEAQWHALRSLVTTLRLIFRGATVIGHNDVSDKDCPCFDVGYWAEHTLKIRGAWEQALRVKGDHDGA